MRCPKPRIGVVPPLSHRAFWPIPVARVIGGSVLGHKAVLEAPDLGERSDVVRVICRFDKVSRHTSEEVGIAGDAFVAVMKPLIVASEVGVDDGGSGPLNPSTGEAIMTGQPTPPNGKRKSLCLKGQFQQHSKQLVPDRHKVHVHMQADQMTNRSAWLTVKLSVIQ